MYRRHLNQDRVLKVSLSTVACLRTVCNQLQDRDDTCQTLQQAADLRCDKKVSKRWRPTHQQHGNKPSWWDYSGYQVMTLADMLKKAGCPKR